MNDDSVIAYGQGLLAQIEKSKSAIYDPVSKVDYNSLFSMIDEEMKKSIEKFESVREYVLITGSRGKDEFEKSLSEAFNPEKIFEIEFVKRVLKTNWCFDMLENEREEMAKMVFVALETGVHFQNVLESIRELTPYYEMLKKASTVNAPISRGRKTNFITFEEA